jgi:hypothetical protein
MLLTIHFRALSCISRAPCLKQELFRFRAGDRDRTDDNNVGNVVLYQLSYTRIVSFPEAKTPF